MLKLYGFPVSNYFNMVKLVLLEKGIPYDYVHTMPSQEGDYLAKSPMGKVPCIETDRGFISETSVILEYLEETGGGKAMLPKDAFERAKVRELMKELELYVELPARTCFPAAFFGGSVSDEVKATAKVNLAKGMACLKRRGRFAPYVAGAEFTLADVMFMYSVNLAQAVSKRLWNEDLLADLPQAAALLKQLGERESARRVAAEQKQ